MAKTKKVPLRSQVKKEDTWDLAPLFKSDAAWDRAYHKLEKKIGGYEKFRGKLAQSAKVIRDCYDFENGLDQDAERLGSYAFLKYSEDVGNSTYLGMVQRYTHLATAAGEAASFIAPEIQAIPKKKMATYLKSKTLAPYKLALERLLRYRPHILSQAEERLLAMQGEVSGTAGKIFGQLNDADLRFGFVKDETGTQVELSQSSFRSLLDSPKRAVRKKAYHQFYEQYDKHANTLATTYNGSVLQDVYRARVRNHPSALEASLFSDNVPVSVYTSLIDAVHSNFDTIHRYLELRRKTLKVKDLHFYDTYVPIVDRKRVKTSFDKAIGMICESLAPLGSAYCNTLEKGLRKGRWADRYENQGKRSGAFSSGGYVGPPYILMNYKDDTLDGVFTLAHEAGHSMHTYYSAKNQPFQYYDYTIFVAEVASTFNEQLLNEAMLSKAKDKKTRAYLLNREIEEIRGTLIRQTMFAEFEKISHEIAEAGEPLTLERFREEYGKLLRAYFGPNFVIDESLTLEALRIPHFYSAFYVYKYATGISAAIALSQKVLNGGKKDRDAYLNFLKSGGSKFPLDLLRDAGVDMERPEPVDTAMARFGHLVGELEDLL